MAYNDFIKFATNHRNLLETAIKKYPTALKPSDLVEFDQVILESKKELRKEGLLEEWMPAVTFNCPEDYLYANAEEIFLESYLGPNYQNILIEQISGEIPVADINAAMKSQIEALKNLADWYFKLPLEQRLKLDRETVDSTKSRKTFMEELKDLESEINGIYGKLEKPTSALGKMANWAKQKISGRLQRGVGTAFGAGEVAKTALEEQKIFEELFGNDQVNEQAPGISFPSYPNFQAAFDAGRVIAPRVRRGLTAAKKAILVNQQTTQAAAAAAKTGGTAAAGTGTAGTGTAAATATGTQTAGAGAKGAAIAGKGAFAKLAAFAGAHPIGVAAGIGALVAAGAAGIKMRNRRKRIETLQAVARNAGAGGSVVAPPVESAAEKVAPPTGGAPTGGAPTGGATTSAAPTGQAKKEAPVEKTADKKDIHIYSGSQGKGFQSRVAQKINLDSTLKPKAGESQKAAAKVMRGLAADLKQANFNVLEEKSSKAPERKEIGFSQTLAALDAVKDNTLRELLRIELLKTLRDEGLKVPDSLKPGSSGRVTAVVAEPAAEPAAAEPAKDNKEGANPKEKADKIRAAKSLLSGINSGGKKTFTKAEWDTLVAIATDPSIGAESPEAVAGRSLVDKYNKTPNFKSELIFNDQEINPQDVEELKVLQNYGNVMESLRRKYRLGLITLKEYNFRKNKIDMMVLKEHVKRQVRSSRK
jgi:hypothetical protein